MYPVSFLDSTNGRWRRICWMLYLKNGSDDLSVELLNIKAFDLVKLTYGLMVAIEKIGLEDVFNAYARGETIQEAQDE